MTSMPAVIHPAAQPPDVVMASRVFGNTVRLEIIRALGRGPGRRAEIVDRTGLTADTLTPQLRELHEVGVVHIETLPGRGRPVLYTLDTTRTRTLMDALNTYVLSSAQT